MARRTAKPKVMTAAQERAWRAIRAFNRIKPQLQRYAQTLTGNPKLRLEATAEGTYTDGKTIYVRPPARLGDNVLHEKALCNKRDFDTHRQLCKACDAHEMVLAAVFHEISHIVFGTLEDPTPAGVVPINDLIAEWHPEDACDHAEKISDATNNQIKQNGDSYMLRCNLFDPVLGMLLNCMEDSRVNTGMFTARPGTRVMFDLHLHEIFHAGISDFVEDDDGPNLWQDRSLDEQVLIGMFLASSEYFDYIDLLSDEAKQIIWSDELDTLLTSVSRSTTVHEVVELTVLTFRALQDLGIMVIPKCVKVEKDEEDPDAEGDEEPSGGGQDSSEDTTGPGSGEETSPRVSGSSGGSGTTGDDSEPEPEDSSDGESSDQDEDQEDPVPARPDSREAPNPDDPDSDAGTDPNAGGVEDGLQPDLDTQDQTEAESSIHPEEGGLEDSETDSDEGQGEEGIPDEPQSIDREALTKLAQRMTMHALIHEENPDADITQFASGESVLSGSAGSTEEGDGPSTVRVVVPAWTTSISQEELDEFLKVLATALQQAMFFDSPSKEIDGVDIVTFPNKVAEWEDYVDPAVLRPGEGILGQVTNETKIALEENKRSRHQRGLKSGRINPRALGKRVPVDDERLFQKKIIPDKRDYFVLIGFDISGSTSRYLGRSADGTPNTLNTRIKRAVMSEAEACHRLGIPFEIWAHTAGWPLNKDSQPGYEFESSTVWAYQVKTDLDPWNIETQNRLAACMAVGGNLDGHTLEFYRKRLDLRAETGKILRYYTDGAMPAENFTEELMILEREIAYCKRTGINLLAVGINTDSPRKHGFDTVEVYNDMDLIKVPRQLAKALTR